MEPTNIPLDNTPGGLPPGVVTVEDLDLTPEEADALEAGLADDRRKAMALPDRFERLRKN